MFTAVMTQGSRIDVGPPSSGTPAANRADEPEEKPHHLRRFAKDSIR